MSSREFLLVKNFSARGELAVKFWSYHEATPVSIIVGCEVAGGACSVSGGEGIFAIGGISRGRVCVGGLSLEGLPSLRLRR